MIALSIAPSRTLPQTTDAPALWDDCRFLSCSVLPVRMACNLNCRFCFSKSSISTLEQQGAGWTGEALRQYFEYAVGRGANRLVITGGGEPLLRPEVVQNAIRVGRNYFHEIALFTNGSYLTRELAAAFVSEGLSYVCFSRHHEDDKKNRLLMGEKAVGLEEFFDSVQGLLRVRATCVLCQSFVEKREHVWDYIKRLRAFGVREFTFKHTYVAYEQSLFAGSDQNTWAASHQIQNDPFAGEGQIAATLPWGPQIKRFGELQLCYYYEPTPEWELSHRLCRSSNLLADGKVYASLEDQRSLLSRPKL
jgi:pyruvate-formate lyase-activating enzyme